MAYIKASPTILAKTAAYTVTTNDGDNVHVNVDATSGAVTITLYATASNAGKIVSVKKTDSGTNAVTIDGNASETIDGALTATLTHQYDEISLTTDGSNWAKVAEVGAFTTVPDGGTGLSSYAVGDLVYASATTTLAKLADVATGQVLVSGGVNTAPAYSASPSLTSLTLSTALTVPNGGTGVATQQAYGVLVGGTTSTGAMQSITPGTSGFVLTSAGTGALPTWAVGGTAVDDQNNILANQVFS